MMLRFKRLVAIVFVASLFQVPIVAQDYSTAAQQWEVPVVSGQSMAGATTPASYGTSNYFDESDATASCGDVYSGTSAGGCAGECGGGVSARSCGLAGRCGNGCCQRYISLYGGWVRVDEYRGVIVDPNPRPPIATDREVEFFEGWTAGIAAGRQFRNRLRGEVEFSYRNNQAENYWNAQTQNGVIIGQVNSDLRGPLQLFTGMANLYRDFPGASLGILTPYVGGGIGFAIADGEFETPMGSEFFIDDTALAFQGIAGVTADLGNRAEFFTEYRYLGTDDLEFSDGGGPAVIGTFHYDSNNIVFGVRIKR